jgi:cob(I)alamin adenosyltransferase
LTNGRSIQVKLYTRTGDQGDTGLFGGGRVPKGHIRVEAYGSVDELNANLGLAVSTVGDEEIRTWLIRTQGDLFVLGAHLASPGADDGSSKVSIPPLPMDRVEEMESFIDKITEETGELRSFILPGGVPGAAALHLARTVCRRAERSVVRLDRNEPINPGLVRYLNRLSDLLFSLARLENYRNGEGDVPWESEDREGA